MKLTKTHIEYFERRINRIRDNKKTEIREKLPVIPDLSNEEKIGYILNGTAKLKSFVTPDKCQRVYLFDAFDYPGGDVIEAKNAEIAAEYVKYYKAIERYAKKLIDKFVISLFKDDNAVEKAIDDFLNKDFIGEK